MNKACWFCSEEARQHPEDGVDAAAVLFDGRFACAWHALFYWSDQPAQLWQKVMA
jgi:hypothetical protein